MIIFVPWKIWNVIILLRTKDLFIKKNTKHSFTTAFTVYFYYFSMNKSLVSYVSDLSIALFLSCPVEK